MIADRLNVRTSNRSGAGQRWAREFGQLSEVKTRKARRGGCIDASFTVAVPAEFGRGEIPTFRRGRMVTVFDGPARIWSGEIVGQVRSPGAVAVECAGWATAIDERFPAFSPLLSLNGVASSTGVAPSVNAAIDGAISLGLPVIRRGDFNTVAPTKIEPLGDLLDRAAAAAGTTWAVNGARELLLVPTGQPARLTVTMTDRPPDVVSEEYVTALAAEFLDRTSTPAGLRRQIAQGTGRLDFAAKPVDLTSLGQISPAEAKQLLLQALRKLVPVVPTITGTFTVSGATLLTTGGVPRSPSRLEPGTVLRAVGLTAQGQYDFSASTVLVADEIPWDAESDTAQITPVGGVRRDFAGVLDAISKATESTDLGNFE